MSLIGNDMRAGLLDVTRVMRSILAVKSEDKSLIGILDRIEAAIAETVDDQVLLDSLRGQAAEVRPDRQTPDLARGAGDP